MSYSSIKVCCRFRPRNELEIKEESGKQDSITYENDSVITEKSRFNFDHVFRENSTQEEVFKASAVPVIEDMLRGYNCTIFAYGQTGSGKSFTVTGDLTNPGLTPRIVEKIFDHIYDSDEDAEFSVCISYVEIYLEKIRDLLNPEEENLKLREGGHKSGIWIQGVTEVYASCYEDVLGIMKEGNSNRSVGQTRMNNKSSRSHSVFILTLSQSQLITNTQITSKLILVDLAGSEKVGKTGATGLLLKQAQHTNKSLTHLGIVIKSLTSNSSHIPYRDSKLTRILTDSLGGNSKTSLIVTCSPSSYNLSETISTLRFGTRVKTIKNKVYRNVEKSRDEYKRLLEEAYERIDDLEQRTNALLSPRKISETGTDAGVNTVDLIEDFEKKIEEQKIEVKEMEIKLVEKEREIQEIADTFQERLAEKENEIEVLTEEFIRKIKEKENEIKEKISEIDKLKAELREKSSEILNSSDSVVEVGPSKNYLQRILESRQEMVSVLEVALRNAEETLKSQRNDYERTIRSLKQQIDDMRDALYKPAVSRAVRNLIVPVRKRRKSLKGGN